MTFDASVLANRVAATLRAYDPGPDPAPLRKRFGTAITELGSNENPLGPSPRALAAMRAALEGSFRYPDPRGTSLKAALSSHLGIGAQRIALGNGSHELLMLLAQCFADGSRSVAFSQYGFAVFSIATASVGAQSIEVDALPRRHSAAPLGHDLAALAGAIRPDTRLIYLANPNNPTGTWFDDATLETFIARVPTQTLIVVDEAYHEYVDTTGLTSAVRFMHRYPNLVVTRTFSKAYGLAGLRVGYVIADLSTIAVLERLRQSFNVNAIALAGAEAALGDHTCLERVRTFNATERQWLTGQLAARGYACLPSQTNFVLVDLRRDASGLERCLWERGVVVRPMSGYGLPHMLRISVGTRSENTRLLEALP